MSASPKEVFRRFGSRRSVDSRKAMARHIAELELQLERIRAVPRAVVETGFGPATVVFSADLDRLLGGTRPC